MIGILVLSAATAQSVVRFEGSFGELVKRHFKGTGESYSVDQQLYARQVVIAGHVPEEDWYELSSKAVGAADRIEGGIHNIVGSWIEESSTDQEQKNIDYWLSRLNKDAEKGFVPLSRSQSHRWEPWSGIELDDFFEQDLTARLAYRALAKLKGEHLAGMRPGETRSFSPYSGPLRSPFREIDKIFKEERTILTAVRNSPRNMNPHSIDRWSLVISRYIPVQSGRGTPSVRVIGLSWKEGGFRSRHLYKLWRFDPWVPEQSVLDALIEILPNPYKPESATSVAEAVEILAEQTGLKFVVHDSRERRAVYRGRGPLRTLAGIKWIRDGDLITTRPTEFESPIYPPPLDIRGRHPAQAHDPYHQPIWWSFSSEQINELMRGKRVSLKTITGQERDGLEQALFGRTYVEISNESLWDRADPKSVDWSLLYPNGLPDDTEFMIKKDEYLALYKPGVRKVYLLSKPDNRLGYDLRPALEEPVVPMKVTALDLCLVVDGKKVGSVRFWTVDFDDKKPVDWWKAPKPWVDAVYATFDNKPRSTLDYMMPTKYHESVTPFIAAVYWRAVMNLEYEKELVEKAREAGMDPYSYFRWTQIPRSIKVEY